MDAPVKWTWINGKPLLVLSLKAGRDKSLIVENCHWGRTVPTWNWCPFHTYRTGDDIMPTYASVVSELSRVSHYADSKLSGPGCWAYPDMMEIGVPSPSGIGEGLNAAETRSHFGAWCIVSSPLILSHDILNDDIAMGASKVWEVISNKEAIRVNQAWAGHSGSVFLQEGLPYSSQLQISKNYKPRYLRKRAGGNGIDVEDDDNTEEEEEAVAFPSFQFFYKPISSSEIALLLMNHHDDPQDFAVDLRRVPGLLGQVCGSHQFEDSKKSSGSDSPPCCARDIWSKKDLGPVGIDNNGIPTFHATKIGRHDSFFLTIKPCPDEWMWVQEPRIEVLKHVL